MNAVSPRCGRPMQRYEAVHGPLLEDPVCGRPEGHNDRCRSVLALARQQPKDNIRLARLKRERRRQALREFGGYGRAA